MTSKKGKKVFTYGGAVICSLGIILAVPLIIHPNITDKPNAPSGTATVVSFTTGNTNTITPTETCTIIYRVDGDLIPITETPEYCKSIKVGDQTKF
jgi:hypothetical protein